jgi:outer membrane biosynthesis protein TonB
MSLAVAEIGLAEPVEIPDEPPDGISSRGIVLSAALHVAIVGVLITGLPRLFAPPPVEEMPVAVELVTIAPETRATHPNPNLPQADAKPEVPEPETPAPKPQPKPEPPKPEPVPPTSAAVSPLPEPQRPADVKPPPPVQPKLSEPKPEAPRPVETVETPKPKEKPEPPRQMAKNETRPEDKKPDEKKYDPSQFAALLKNLAPQHTALSPDAPLQNPRLAASRPSSQPKAPLGSQLTASELDMVRHQIARCWNVPAGARDAKDLVVEIKVAVDPDGTVQQATIVDQGRMSDPFYRAAAESARRAFFNPLCRPLRLPAEKYAIWKDLVVDFSPKDIL